MKHPILTLILLLLSIQTSISQCYCEDCPVPIDFGVTSTATLNVSGATNMTLGTNGQSLSNIGLHFMHDAAQELTLRLIAPNGSSVFLMIGEGLNGGFEVMFDIDFVPCSETPNPDCINSGVWTSTDIWDEGPYSGSYLPESGCLEDLTGDVNGLWTLEMMDVFILEDGELFCFDISFADPSGISCNSSECAEEFCEAQGGSSMSPPVITAGQGDPILDIDYTIDYGACEVVPPSPEYSLVFFIFEQFPGGLLDIVDDVDLTTYPQGNYIVISLSILTADIPNLPTVPDPSFSIVNFYNFLQTNDICADPTIITASVFIENCVLPSVVMPFEVITAPEGDPAFDTDWISTITYVPNNPPDPSIYGFYFVVYDQATNVLIGYFTTDDFTTLPEGNYLVNYFVYALTDAALLPPIDGTNTFADLVSIFIDDDDICAAVSGANLLNVEDSCLANAGDLPVSTFDVCVGDPSLNLDLNPSYPGGGEPGVLYSYTYVISQNGVISSYDMNTDFTSFPAGEYEVCGLSYLTTDEPLIPSADGSYSIGDLQDDIDNDLFCGDLTEDCQTILINEVPTPIFTGPMDACEGELVQYVVDNFNATSDYLFFVQQGGFSTLEDNGDGTFDITWINGPAILCVTESINGCSEQVCIDIDVIPQPEVTISGIALLCSGDDFVYTFDPVPVGSEFYDVIVTGGTITNQTLNTVTVLWDDSADGSITATLMGGLCDSEPAVLDVVKVEVDFPLFSFPSIVCSAAEFSIPDINDPLIFNWDWTGTNVDIVINGGTVNLIWQGVGPGELCLEIFTICGQEEQCFPFDVVQTPEPIIDPNLEFCSLTFTLSATPSNGNLWLWTSDAGNSVTYSNVNNFETEVTVPGPGTYTFTLQESNGDCVSLVETTVVVADGLDIIGPSFDCDIDGFYIVNFTIDNGTPPYTVNGNTIGSSIFSSAPIVSGASYSFTVLDDEGCQVLLEGDHVCPCITDAGSMDFDLLIGCISSGIELQGVHNADQIFDANDVGSYVLHTSVTGILGTVLDENNTGLFGFDPLDMVAGQIYYISYVAGDPLGGGVDLTDPCLSVSVGQPIVFFDDPNVDGGQDMEICELEYNLSANAPTTDGIWSLISSPVGSNFEFVYVTNETLFQTDLPGTYNFSYLYEENGCSGTDEVEITILESPNAESVIGVCDDNQFTVEFTISGGTSPYSVNGEGIADAFFISTEFTSGDVYSFTIVDAVGCMSDEITGTVLCNCDSDAGTMSQDSIEICAVVGSEILGTYNGDGALDGSDTEQYVLHTSASNILGTILATNATPEFIYEVGFGTNVTLYISHIVGDDLGGNVDLNDDCLSVSLGQPVVISTVIKVDAGEYISGCDFTIDLEATAEGLSGEWTIIESPTGASPSILQNSNPNTVFETDNAGTYSLVWNPIGYECGIGDTTTFTLDLPMSLDSEMINCSDDILTYSVDVSISGGIGPYFIAGEEVSNNPTIGPFASGEAYNVVIVDSKGCELNISGLAMCDCMNAGGTMALDTLKGCFQDTLFGTYNEDAILDSDDAEFFVVHTSAADTLAAVLAIYTEPNVVFLPNMIAGNVYYLSHIIGNAAGNGLDFNDPCLKLSPGQPFIFNAPPEVDAGIDQEVCGLTTNMMGSTSEVIANWSVIQTPFGAIVNIDEDDLNSELSVTLPGEYILELETDNDYCSRTDTVSVIFVALLSFNDVNIECANEGYTVSFTIQGGNEEYLVDGVLLAENAFESELLAIGEPYSFAISDSGDCPPIEVEGVDTCDCENDAGTMNSDLIDLCIDEIIDINLLSNNDVILDDEDIRYLVIHDSAANELGDILGIIDYNEGVVELAFDDFPFIEGVTYYISTVLADLGALDGSVDDPCLAVASGSPIVWNAYDEVSFGEDLEACTGETIFIDISTIGDLPIEVVVSDDLGFNETILIDQSDYSFEYIVSGEALLTVSSVVNAMCFTIDNGELMITIAELPSAEVRDFVTICNNEEYGSIIRLEDLILSGFAEGQWFFEGNSVEGAIDFDGFAEGEYKIEYRVESALCSDFEIYEVAVLVTDCDCPLFDYGFEDATCFGQNDGMISILVSDGIDINDFTLFLNEEEIESITEINDLSPGTYSLEISDGNDCEASFEIMISEPAPVQITLGEDMEVEINDPVVIEAITNLMAEEIGGVTWESLSGILEDNDLMLNTSFQSDDMISINIIDENGCSGMDDIMVRVTRSDFDIPNVINTNSTSGNEVFRIFNSESIDEIVSMSIYDRWGNKVHGVNNIPPDSELAQWDGTFGGVAVNSGVFVYRIEMIVRGELEVVFGDLTVL